jgi:hypothetical protein
MSNERLCGRRQLEQGEEMKITLVGVLVLAAVGAVVFCVVLQIHKASQEATGYLTPGVTPPAVSEDDSREEQAISEEIPDSHDHDI